MTGMFGKRRKSSRYADDGYSEHGYETGEYEAVEYDGGYDAAGYETAGYEGAEYDAAEAAAVAHRSYAAGYPYDDDAPTDERSYAGVDFDSDTPPEPTGPYDYDDVAERLETMGEPRLDLGSVLLPVPPGGQLQVEMTPDGQPQAVHLATEHGRITVAAYAAPKSTGQWRLVAADLAESLRNDGATVSVQTGPWGRELLAVTEGADLRFIGVDGYRWMLRLVAAGPSGAANEGSPLVAAARAILGETVVRRGDDPLPVRDPLPVVLPQQLTDQLAAVHQQQLEAQQQAMAAQAAAAQAGPQSVLPPRMPEAPRRGADGSAMQQLGLN